MSTTYLDRTEASKILKVSTRTVDRYVRKYRFKTKKNGRKVLLKKEDVDQIIQEHVGQFIDISSTKLDKKLDKNSVQNEVDNVSNITVKNVEVKERVSENEGNTENKIYKKLYEDTKEELKQKQERLEAATYRVGQLESQIKNSVPLLDFNRKEKELKEAQLVMEKRAIEEQQRFYRMERSLKTERIAKWIYLSLAGLLLVVEPIVFLMWAFS